MYQEFDVRKAQVVQTEEGHEMNLDVLPWLPRPASGAEAGAFVSEPAIRLVVVIAFVLVVVTEYLRWRAWTLEP